jgi:alpha-glucosidase (family GH31 glycosyl hydrolase)
MSATRTACASLLWQIPVLKTLEEPHAQHDLDEARMLEKGYVIRNGDGRPTATRAGGSQTRLVIDVTNPGRPRVVVQTSAATSSTSSASTA